MTLSLLAAAFTSPLASAHEHYLTDDGKFSIVLGEQNEPVYTYDWTNLDFIVSEDSENGTGGPVPGVHETVEATLIAPGGEELSLPLEPQFGERGRYAFAEDYYLTQPGQYEVRLEGNINGTDVTGTYLLPGPRESISGQGFPADDVPSALDLRSQLQDKQATIDQQADEISDLETRISELESKLSTLESDVQSAEQAANNAPGAGPLAALAALAGVALIAIRRRER